MVLHLVRNQWANSAQVLANLAHDLFDITHQCGPYIGEHLVVLLHNLTLWKQYQHVQRRQHLFGVYLNGGLGVASGDLQRSGRCHVKEQPTHLLYVIGVFPILLDHLVHHVVVITVERAIFEQQWKIQGGVQPKQFTRLVQGSILKLGVGRRGGTKWDEDYWFEFGKIKNLDPIFVSFYHHVI